MYRIYIWHHGNVTMSHEQKQTHTDDIVFTARDFPIILYIVLLSHGNRVKAPIYSGPSPDRHLLDRPCFTKQLSIILVWLLYLFYTNLRHFVLHFWRSLKRGKTVLRNQPKWYQNGLPKCVVNRTLPKRRNAFYWTTFSQDRWQHTERFLKAGFARYENSMRNSWQWISTLLPGQMIRCYPLIITMLSCCPKKWQHYFHKCNSLWDSF